MNDSPSAVSPRPDRPPAEEIEIIKMMAEGLTDRAIARLKGVSVVTVRRRAHMFRKRVGAGNRVQAIAIAAGKGWIDLGICRDSPPSSGEGERTDW